MDNHQVDKRIAIKKFIKGEYYIFLEIFTEWVSSVLLPKLISLVIRRTFCYLLTFRDLNLQNI